MSARDVESPRVWPLRVVEFAPLAVLVLFLAVWFVVPAPMRSTALQIAAAPVPSDPSQALQVADPTTSLLDSLNAYLHNGGAIYSDNVQTADAQLSVAVNAATGMVMSQPWRLYDSRGALKPFALSPSDPVLAPLKNFGAESGARVFAFAVPPRPAPKVALWAAVSLATLTPAERAEFETSGALELLRHRQRGEVPATLPVDPGSVGSTYGSEQLSYGGAIVGGHFYEIYQLSSRDTRWASEPTPFPMLPNLTAVGAPENRQALERIVNYTGGAIFVVGPTDAAPVAQWAPPGTSSQQVGALAAAISRGQAGLEQGSGVRRLDPALAARIGGGRWVDTAMQSPNLPYVTTRDGRQVAAAPMVFVAVWDNNPDITSSWEQVGRTPLREFWVWLALRLPFTLGALGVLLAISLVASPFAFAAERRLTAEIEIEREQERIRREARQSVVTRLTELSRRIDETAEQTTDASRGEVARAARDIDATLLDLRRILGELSARGDGDE